MAFPIIGAGSGGFGAQGALELMVEAFDKIESKASVCIIKFVKDKF